MQPSIHLVFDGRCEAAFRFYEELLGAKLGTLVRYGDTPMAKDVPPDWQDKIVHGSLHVGDAVVAGADVPPGKYEPPRGFYLLLSPTELSVGERTFAALADQGTVRMPLQKTFWTAAFGVVVDRFGIPWEVSCTRPE